ncbi:hypothetical protein HYFRA_00009921 [Hymenoscyphus fraxineus]|uniref:Cytochrome P450 n=1 Tax=Hymenoscyphus fraxineus TaxID=746836 RepID=A0A9N9L342_9HELO|nr:hypothetical protein HYFRA_00009921 [Hymenoscyphus fraxineus]
MIAQRTHLVAFVAGVCTHLFYFKSGEHHRHGSKYVKAAFYAFVLLPATQMIALSVSLMSALRSSAAIFGYLLLGLYSSLLFYRLLAHPLNKFPGPIAARIGDLWLTTQLGKSDMHKTSVHLYNKYGPYVRVGSSYLMIVHPLAVSAVHGPQSKCRKADLYDFEQPNRGIATRNKELHHGRRRVWSRGFGDKALRGYESRVAVYIQLLLDRLYSSAESAVDTTKLMEFFAFDTMGDLGLGKSFGMLENDSHHSAIKHLVDSLEMMGVRLPMWLIRLLVDSPLAPTETDKFLDFCYKQLAILMNDEKRLTRPSIMAPLLAHYESLSTEKQDISVIRNDVRFIIIAGSDTVAATLAFTFYYLARYPKNIDKLREELLPLRSANGHYEHDKIQNAEHLNAVINEALRLHPPASTIPRVTPPEGIMVEETFIPGNMTVFTSQYAIGRCGTVYRNANEFIPERWSSRPELIIERSGYAPFSTGSHSCIGRPLALMEMRLAIAECISRFDIKFAEGFEPDKFIDDVKDCMSWHMGALNLCYSPWSQSGV